MRGLLPRQRPEHQRGLRLWPIRRVLVLAFAATAVAAAGVFFIGWKLLGVQGLASQQRISTNTLFDLAKLSFGVVAGAGALVALVVAYRRQKVGEDAVEREKARLHNERFTNAVDQLGNESEAVQLGAVHALASLADDAPSRDLRQTCIDVLCAYLRLPYTAKADLPEGDAQAQHSYLALREVRHTVIRLIRNHLRLAPEHPHSWQGHQFDFTTVTFDGGDFSYAVFSGGTVNFFGAEFSGGKVSFSGARFSGGKVVFRDAKISDGLVNFYGAMFSGTRVDFCNVKVTGGKITFRNSNVSNGIVDFRDAEVSGGTISFRGAEISAGRVNFAGAGFTGGTIDFRCMKFAGGTVNFSGVRFSGARAEFSDVQVSESQVTFFGAKISAGRVNFRGAGFTGGTVNFGAAFARGTVNFSGARFSGGTVDLSTASGVPPTGLLPEHGGSLPAGVTLPIAWYPTEV
ncbi:pentapeptide repeat-containing protein [Streptomyces avidinii]|uniref:pentapeptide repeat-containing protein n=1 Tax=Streptomyces avidinii TaxID=1895 RepID=UPI0038681617|nr:pentapeptide repeat-containing protein [Streptomyces avidinii]